MRRLLWLLVGLWMALPVSAQERITLAEVIPALKESELGEIDLGEAPAPGMSRVVLRSEVLAALHEADRSAKGLDIPRSTRVSREARRIEPNELAQLLKPSLQEGLAPCELQEIRKVEPVTVSAGPLTVRVETRPPARSGYASAVAVLESGGRALRLPLRLAVVCPPPLVQPAGQVHVVVRIGNVIASVTGEAHQAGRLNDIVLVSRSTDGVRVRARVVSRDTVEVVDR